MKNLNLLSVFTYAVLLLDGLGWRLSALPSCPATAYAKAGYCWYADRSATAGCASVCARHELDFDEDGATRWWTTKTADRRIDVCRDVLQALFEKDLAGISAFGDDEESDYASCRYFSSVKPKLAIVYADPDRSAPYQWLSEKHPGYTDLSCPCSPKTVQEKE